MLVSRFNWMSRLTPALRGLGPYAALELMLPGGTLILASVWAFRHRRWFLTQAHRMLTIFLALAAGVVARSALPLGVQPAGSQQRATDIHARETQRLPHSDCRSQVAFVDSDASAHGDSFLTGNGNVMKRDKSQVTPAWVVDYSAARAHAIRWLGDRYLLARPINRKHDVWGTSAAALSDTPAPRAEH